MKFSKRHFVSAILAIIALPQILCALNEYQWQSGSFSPITLANISHQSDISTGSATLTLIISGDDAEAVITADNTAAAQLSNGTDTLVTEYSIGFDGDGTAISGGASMAEDEYESYDSFLSGGVNIKYVPGDNNVRVTLRVRASNRPNNVADKGTYTATQTLTVTWDGL
jgi:hypothetical protein